MARHATRQARRRARIRRRLNKETRHASKPNSRSPFGARTNLKYKPATPVKESAKQQSTREHMKGSSKDLSQGKPDSKKSDKPKYYTGEGVKSGKSFHTGVSDKSKPKDLKSHVADLMNKLNDDPTNAKVKSELAGARIRLAKDILGKKKETTLRKESKKNASDEDKTTKNTRRAALKEALGDNFAKYYHTKNGPPAKNTIGQGGKGAKKTKPPDSNYPGGKIGPPARRGGGSNTLGTVKPPTKYKGPKPTSSYPGGKIGPPARKGAPKMAPRPGAAPGPGYKPPKRKKFGSGLTGVR